MASNVEEVVEKSIEDECLGKADVVTVREKNVEVEKLSEKAKVSKTLGAKKVWTKLNNGLFGWRKMPTAKRRCKQSAAPPRSRICRGSASKRNTSVSASPTSEKEKPKTTEVHSNLVAKDAEFDSCGTAQDCVGLDGLNFSCRPGQSSDFKANNNPANKFEFGREENNAVRGSRPRLFGVNRGQGK